MSWTSAYKSSLRHLSTPSLHGEILKLENSIKHLRRSNDELRVYESSGEEDTSWIAPVIAENEQVIVKQNEQVELVMQEISDRGVKTEDVEEAMLVPDSMKGNLHGNGEQDLEQEEIDDGDGMELDEPSNGVHL